MRIFLSGDLDEDRIAEIVGSGAPADAFGVGTQLGTSGDAPWLGGVYKLVEDARGPKMKLSTGKVTLPGRKQVYRVSRNGRYDQDVMALRDEDVPGGQPLLRRVMAGGRRTGPREPLGTLRERCRRALESLPDGLRALAPAQERYPVRLSPGLEALYQRIRRQEG